MTETEQSFVSLVQQTRYGVAAVALAAFWIIESIAPMFAGRSRRGSHLASNLGLAAINALVAALLAVSIIAAAEWTRTREFGLLNVLAVPVWVQWIAAIVLLDCWQYWWHRMNHRIPFLWRFHAVHHADAELDVSSGVRFHTGEMTLSFIARLIVIPLLGITLPQLAIYEAISLPVILFHHSNLRISGRADRWLRWLIVTPWMHFVHHSRWRPETDSNYSSLLSMWDRIFGSFRLRERPGEISLGLDEWREHDWRRLPGMLVAPFRKAPPRVNNEDASATTSSTNPAAASK